MCRRVGCALGLLRDLLAHVLDPSRHEMRPTYTFFRDQNANKRDRHSCDRKIKSMLSCK